jgi:hypothetical protein
MIHITGVQISTCTQRVLTALAEKGITDYTLYTPDMMGKAEHKVLTIPQKEKNP